MRRKFGFALGFIITLSGAVPHVAWGGYPKTSTEVFYRRTDAFGTYLYQARCSLGIPSAKCSLTVITVYNDKNNVSCFVSIGSEFTDLAAEGIGDRHGPGEPISPASEWIVKFVKGATLQTYFLKKSGLTITEASLTNPSLVNKKLEAVLEESTGAFLDVPHGNCKKMAYSIQSLYSPLN